MASLEFVSDFIFNNLSMPLVTNGGVDFTCRCPYCGDSKKDLKKRRFHLKYKNENSIYFNCFNCNISGTFIDLYCFIKNINKQEAYKQLRNNNLENLKIKFKKSESIIKLKNIENNLEDFKYILNDCLSLDDKPNGFIQTKLYNILKEFYDKRHIDKSFKLYISYDGEWKNRIIIPVFDENRMIYFQGRAISDNTLPKYKNPQSEKSSIIFNKNLFDKDKYIIISEGIIDAMSVGSQGTVCFGASIQESFIKSLEELTDEGIIIALDNDKTGIKNMLKLINIYKNCTYFIMPFKDIKDLNQLKSEKNIDNIYDFIVHNSYDWIKAKVKLQLIQGEFT